jgi:putative endonuclease
MSESVSRNIVKGRAKPSLGSIEDAIAREKQIKGWRRSKKNSFVEAANPTWAVMLDPAATKGPSLRSG